ncbi:MAG: hypothetical protein K6G63_10070 [Eubacterium sp.]|nr:hypothetical protein [Eubacterium sp.]
MTKLKICGLMNEEDALFCKDAGVDIIGFVTEYPLDVPWNLSREMVKNLIDSLGDARGKSCIVVGGDADHALELIQYIKPGFVQLHYQETLDDIRDIAARTDVRSIKTVPLDAESRERQSGTADIGECARRFAKAGADILLVDARGPENVTKSGALDVELFGEVKNATNRLTMAAGGIDSSNILDYLNSLHPDIIDIMTGVEDRPGAKNHPQIADCISKLR